MEPSTAKGTDLFLSPELALHRTTGDSSKYDPFASDMWAFGISSYQLLTGKLPFKHLSEIIDENKLQEAITRARSEIERVDPDDIYTLSAALLKHQLMAL